MKRALLSVTAVVCVLLLSALLGYYLLRDEQTNRTEILADISETGTVRFIDVEGGFFGIMGDDGKHYDPINLDEEFQINLLRVRFQANICENQDSFHMWGILVEIVEIEKLD